MLKIIKLSRKKRPWVFFYIFIKNIVKDKIVANTDNNIYGTNRYFFLLSNREVSSYKNKVDINVPRHDINPKKLFFNPKNTNVKL